VRRFIKGDAGMKSAFATRVAGSSDLYKVNQRKPYHGVNFIVAHDGFCLMDLVSYNDKHNEANGENGMDGSNDNFSWNCGVEGQTEDAGVVALRHRQMKNFHLALMISQGTPMMLMADEYGHSKGGNNNSYGHDTAMNHFQWQQLEQRRQSTFRFFSELIHFRRAHPVLRRSDFLNEVDVTWHEDQWENPESRFLAFTLHDRGLPDGVKGGRQEDGTYRGSLYLAFNAHTFVVTTHVPPPPPERRWRRIVDTNLAPPDDIMESDGPMIDSEYLIAPFAAIMLVAQ